MKTGANIFGIIKVLKMKVTDEELIFLDSKGTNFMFRRAANSDRLYLLMEERGKFTEKYFTPAQAIIIRNFITKFLELPR